MRPLSLPILGFEICKGIYNVESNFESPSFLIYIYKQDNELKSILVKMRLVPKVWFFLTEMPKVKKIPKL